MKKLTKVDYVIIAVLLALIAMAVFLVSRGNKQTSAGTSAGTSAVTEQQPVEAASKTVTYQDYNGKKIGILTGTNMEAESFKYFPDSEYLYFDGYPNLNTALMNGAVDAFLLDEPAARCIHNEQPTIDYIKERLTNNNYSFAFRKNEESETKLRDQLNEYLAKSRADGTLAAIDSVWFGTDESKKVVDMSGLTGENGTVHVVTTSTDEPFSYIKDGKHVGYDIDVTVHFCREYGYALEIGDVDFSARIPALASGKYEFTTSMNVTPEREEEVLFSDPVSDGGIVVAVRSEDLAGTSDASAASTAEHSYSKYNGKRIGITVGSSTEPLAFEYFPDSEYFYFDNGSDMIVALQTNKIDGFLDDEPVAEMMHAAQNDVDYIKERVIDDDYYFSFQKDTERSRKLRSEFNEVLAELKSQGELDRMKEKWMSSDDSVKTYDDSGLTGENGTLKVVLPPNNPPFSYTSYNKLQGYAVELATIFARKYGYSIEFEQANLASCIAGVSMGKYDMLAYSLSYTEERAESMDYSDCIYNGGIVLMVRSSDLGGTAAPASSGQDIDPLSFNSSEYTVGVPLGASAMFAAENLLPDAKRIVFNDSFSAYESVRLGKIDAYCYDRIQMQVAIDSGFKGVRLLEGNLGDDINVAVGISRTSSVPDLKNKINAFLAELRENGTLDDMRKRWTTDKNYEMPDIPEPESPDITIKVGTTGTVEPYSFYIGETLTGFDIELIKRFALYMNAKVEYKIYDFSGIITAAGTNEIDCIFSNLNVTSERAEKIDFSDTIYTVQNTLMVADKSQQAAAAVESNNASEAESVAEDKTWFDSLKESFDKNFVREDRYKLILEGIRTTCIITSLSVIFGSLLAFLICLFRRTDSLLAGRISDLYVKLLQGTPMVVLLMILYYVIFGKSGIAAMWVAVIGFSLNFGAYVSEILRSGIESIDGGQREAALALGFSENQAFFRFIFPQAAVRQIPVYRGEIISLLKNTSIVGYIAIQDLTKMSDIIRSRTYEAFFPLIVTAVIYFILAWIISLILRIILGQADPKRKKRKAKSAGK